MLRQVARGLLMALAVVGLAGVAFVGYAWFSMFGSGLSAEARARILVHDTKFGRRAVARAILDGDRLLLPLRGESEDFSALNGRSAEWIAEVLGAMETEASRAVLLELHGRSNRLARLVGTVGLAQRRALPGPASGDSFLAGLAREGTGHESRLAVEALGRSGDTNAIAVLVPLLSEPRGYWIHAGACVALARLEAREAIPVLRGRLGDRGFAALPEAFRALIALGDPEAVPLAIARIGPEIRERNSGFVVNELQKVTGQRLGWEREPWERWWRRAGPGWAIPPEYRRAWDRQPRLY